MSSHSSGWIGVDLDGTLAHYDGWKGCAHIGDPVPAMVERVKGWLAEGRTVKIFTARMHGHGAPLIGGGTEDVKTPIELWCRKHVGQVLEITNVKDFGMIELWDDRAVQVEVNTGRAMVEPQRPRGAKGVSISIPLPPPVLRANGSHCHWRRKHTAVKVCRGRAKLLALAALNGQPAPRWPKAKAVVEAWFAAEVWDPDNIVASLKSTFDGMADAGVVANDRDLWPDRPIRHPYAKKTGITITIFPE